MKQNFTNESMKVFNGKPRWLVACDGERQAIRQSATGSELDRLPGQHVGLPSRVAVVRHLPA